MSVLSNLSIFLRILHIYNSLQSSYQTSVFLAKNHFGFQKKNTELVALTLINKSLPALAGKQYALCVFLDYSASLDTLSRSKIYDKIEGYGIRGVSLDFIMAYFANRSQFVYYYTVKSSIR